MARMTIPTSQNELEELLADTSKISNLAKEGQLEETMQSYAAMVNKKNPDIQEQIKEQVKAVAFDFLRENKQSTAGATEIRPGKGKDVSVYNSAAPGADVEAHFAGMSDFFQTIYHNADRTPESIAKLNKVRNAASSYDGASGGFLIPETTRSEILSLTLEDAQIRPRATVIPMSTPRTLIPANDVTSHVNSVYGGVTAYWESEAAAHTDVNATFQAIELNAHKLTAYTTVPNELLADGVGFEAFMNKAFPKALAFYEDKAFFAGSGVGQPEGFLNSDAAVSVAKESGQAADTILWQNIVKMYSRMLPSSLNSAVWIVPPNAFPELATMALSVGTGGSAIWLNNGQVGPPMTILGRPVIVSEHAPTLGSAKDISFVDLSYYLIGDRQMMTATSSPHYLFNQDKTAFKVISRVDGRVWMNSALTPANNGDTLSPVVTLAERA